MPTSAAPPDVTAPRHDDASTRPTTSATVAIFGAAGTTGVELASLLRRHPDVELAFCTSRDRSTVTLDEVDPAAPDVAVTHPDDVDLAAVDLAFLCVPHGTAGPLAERCIEAGCRVVDVSGDHRLRAADAHARTYGSERSQSLADAAVYGITEHARDAVAKAKLVANPGCYATTAVLALAPLAADGLLEDLAVVDAKSGVSGAGRTPTATNHFCSVDGDVQPYKVGRAHRHVAEIEQQLAAPDGKQRPVVFNPHLVPLERGIEASIVVRGASAERVRECLERAYDGEAFVRVLPEGRQARIRGVARTNRADLAVNDVEGTDAVVITAALDNLLKGAAGQAVQNMNVMLGLPEDRGLTA